MEIIPPPSPVPFGVTLAIEAAGIALCISPDGWEVSDAAAALAIIAAYDPLPAAIAAKSAEITAAKWVAIDAGIVVSGIPVRTDAASLSMLQGLAFMANATGGAFNFKASNGKPYAVNSAQAIGIAVAAGKHVQACFNREAELLAALNSAATWQDALAIDAGAGFPSNE